MADIYDQHQSTFGKVAAHVVLKDGKRVGTVAIKYPSGQSLRLWAYVHFLGAPMVRGYAGGGGYDKTSAAFASAASKVIIAPHGVSGDDVDIQRDFVAALMDDNGSHWDRQLQKAGFEVLQAVSGARK